MLFRRKAIFFCIFVYTEDFEKTIVFTDDAAAMA